MPNAVYFPQHNLLKRLVVCFWYCDEENADIQNISLPIQHIEIVLNYGDVYEVADKNDKVLLKNNKFWIAGLQSEHVKTTIKGRNESLGIVFHPLGMNAFIKAPMSEFSKSHIDLKEIWREEIDFLWEEIHDVIFIKEKFALVEQFLLKKIISTREFGQNLLFPLKRLQLHSEALKVQDLYKSLGISRKSLNHLFKKYIGMSPGEYKRLLVFNQSLEGIHALGSMKLSSIGYDCNYFDQAHFIKEFFSFSGLTPGEYLDHCKKNRTDSEYPNYIDLG